MNELWCARCGQVGRVFVLRPFDHGCHKGFTKIGVFDALRDHWKNGCAGTIIFGSKFQFFTASQTAYGRNA
jgi:hypothetical protein